MNTYNEIKVFISYAREDESKAISIYKSLEKISIIKPWIDVYDLSPGDDWEYKISHVLENCQFVIILLSKHSINTVGYVQKEVREVLDLYNLFPPGKIFIIPVRLEKCKPKHRELKKIHWVDIFDDFEFGMRKIISTIIENCNFQNSVEIHNYSNDEITKVNILTNSEINLIDRTTPNIKKMSQKEIDIQLGTYYVETILPDIINKVSNSYRRNIAIIFIDIDELTIINKQFGNMVGDEVLKIIGGMLNAREIIYKAGRCGDDTFYALLLKVDHVKAKKKCEKIRKQIERFSWFRVAPNLRVTCTIGFSILTPEEDPKEWIYRAIHGMLDGKKLGGNIVNQGPNFSGIIDYSSEVEVKSQKPIPKSYKKEIDFKKELNDFSLNLRDHFS